MARRWTRIIESFFMSIFFFFFAGACYYVLPYQIGEDARFWATIGGPLFVLFGVFALIVGIYELVRG